MHSPYGSDLAPNDYHLLLSIENDLAGLRIGLKIHQ